MPSLKPRRPAKKIPLPHHAPSHGTRLRSWLLRLLTSATARNPPAATPSRSTALITPRPTSAEHTKIRSHSAALNCKFAVEGAVIERVLSRLYTTYGSCRCTEVLEFFGEFDGIQVYLQFYYFTPVLVIMHESTSFVSCVACVCWIALLYLPCLKRYHWGMRI